MLPNRRELLCSLFLPPWITRRDDILRNMQLVMGPLPDRPTHPARFTSESEVRESGFRRLKIRYESEPGDLVPAWLFLPDPLPKPASAVLCLHQTTRIGKDEPAGLGGKPNLHYAKELAQRGFVSLAPDYPNYGDYKFDPYANGYASATMKGIVNHMRAVDLLLGLPSVGNAGVCGHSLGGHNSLFVAAFDSRIKAVVSSCGFNSFRKYYGGNLAGWSHKGYMPRIADRYEKSPEKMPFDFPEVLAFIAPRAIFINAPVRDSNFEVSGVRDCVDFVRPLFRSRPEALVAEHPDTGHDFPPEVRKRSYDFLRRFLA